MRLTQRIRHLEGVQDRQGRRICTCKDKRPNFGVYYEEEQPPEVEAKMCERCGGRIEPLLIHVVYDNGEPLSPEDVRLLRENAPGRSGARGAAR